MSASKKQHFVTKRVSDSISQEIMLPTKSRKSYCTTSSVGVGVGGGVSKMLKFFNKVFEIS